jgi:hypothetical protein
MACCGVLAWVIGGFLGGLYKSGSNTSSIQAVGLSLYIRSFGGPRFKVIPALVCIF